LIMPTRVRSGIGGNGCACEFGKFGSRGSCCSGSVVVGGVVGCVAGATTVPGGAWGAGCWPEGGAVGGVCGSLPGGWFAGGVAVGVCAMPAAAVNSKKSASTDAFMILNDCLIAILLGKSKGLRSRLETHHEREKVKLLVR